MSILAEIATIAITGLEFACLIEIALSVKDELNALGVDGDE